MKGAAHVFVLFSTNPNAHAFGYATNNRVLCRVLVESGQSVGCLTLFCLPYLLRTLEFVRYLASARTHALTVKR